MTPDEIIAWLLQGDVAICYQVHRDLLLEKKTNVRKQIELEGWGARYLARRKPNGYWGKSFYQPKWISSHYTLLELRNLCISTNNPLIRQSIDHIVHKEKGADGGVACSRAAKLSDVCVNGMFLNYASYFKTDQKHMKSIVDFLLEQKMPDKGFNCFSNRTHPVHSSLHSTLSVLEGIVEYKYNGYTYRLQKLMHAKQTSEEFILMHQLYLSDRTGKVISEKFLRMPNPSRWFYNFLRALDYFQYARKEWDERMQPAIDLLLKKKTKDGLWKLNASHSGRTYFEMEKAGKPSRWNTLRALRVLKHFRIE